MKMTALKSVNSINEVLLKQFLEFLFGSEAAFKEIDK